MTLSDNPAELHRQVAAMFGERVRGTTEWNAPSPVPNWNARDIVAHLIEWFSGFLAFSAGIKLPEGPSVDQDPVAAWQMHTDGIQAILDDPAMRQVELSTQYVGTMPVGVAIDRFYTPDVFMHTWDLSKATGQSDRLDEDFCIRLFEEMSAMEDAIRTSGQFGSRVAVPEDANAQTRLIGFIGRDPSWAPSVDSRKSQLKGTPK